MVGIHPVRSLGFLLFVVFVFFLLSVIFYLLSFGFFPSLKLVLTFVLHIIGIPQKVWAQDKLNEFCFD